MHELYRRARLVFDHLIPQINKNLSEKEVREVSLFMSAALEGQTIFVGFNKPWAEHREAIVNIAVNGLLNLVRTVKPGDIGNKKLRIVKQ
jgi:hypothetical protein